MINDIPYKIEQKGSRKDANKQDTKQNVPSKQFSDNTCRNNDICQNHIQSSQNNIIEVVIITGSFHAFIYGAFSSTPLNKICTLIFFNTRESKLQAKIVLC